MDINAILQHFYEGDFFGAFQAIYINSFGSIDLFYGIFAFGLAMVFYIRTKSIVVPCIAWILLGSLYIVAMPLISLLAVLLVSFGVAGLLFRLYTNVRSP